MRKSLLRLVLTAILTITSAISLAEGYYILCEKPPKQLTILKEEEYELEKKKYELYLQRLNSKYPKVLSDKFNERLTDLNIAQERLEKYLLGYKKTEEYSLYSLRKAKGLGLFYLSIFSGLGAGYAYPDRKLNKKR